MPVGKVGGDNTFGNIAAVAAERSAESPQISPKLHSEIGENEEN